MGPVFSMKDLGHLHYFLGMEVHRSSYGMHLSQFKYIMDHLTCINMLDCKPVSNPAVSGKHLSLYDGKPLSDIIEFRSVVSALQYLTFIRSDIALHINQVCQFMHKPTTTHWIAVKRILRYLKSTPDHGLVYKPGSLTISAFTDSDYVGDLMIVSLLVDIASSLILTLFSRVPRNKEVFLVPARSLNIVSLQLQPQQFHGFAN